VPGVPSPIVGAAKRGLDLVVIREAAEGLFASMGIGVRAKVNAGSRAATLKSLAFLT
jgi:isocitrate/isopropylmalate dehydrogenase